MADGSGLMGPPGAIRTGVLASQLVMELALKYFQAHLQNGMIVGVIIFTMKWILFAKNDDKS